MINYENNVFYLSTKNTSYWFRVTKYSHLEHIYYGKYLRKQNIEPLLYKQTAMKGSQVLYNKKDPLYCLDNMCLEWSSIGTGDYRESPIEIIMPDGTFINDFVFEDYNIIEGYVKIDSLPSAYGEKDECKTLKVKLKDISNNVILNLYYTVYEKRDVITRRCVLVNKNQNKLQIRKIMSMMIDMPNEGCSLITFDGDWIKETNKHTRKIQYGKYINSSNTGSSSNRHNPGFIIANNNSTEDTGDVYGFNLVYSGNHEGGVELSSNNVLRIFIGINPYCFRWTLKQNEKFHTPEAILSYSNKGFNGLSHNFHSFINNNIIRGKYKNEIRPILINSWEAFFFKYNQRKLLKYARKAKKLGVELFVLDDGWFGNRDDDTSSLGDYSVNKKKFPSGLMKFANKINQIGMKFGLWFEPEMINEESKLYRKHSEYAVKTPNKKNTLGRNQMVLDLINNEVRDYIVRSISEILDKANIEYVKWDMNRHISDAYSSKIKNQGEFYHRYILGLYDILNRIFIKRPNILLESCSSGGNRFDLGMLCYSPQIWASDNTDPIDRLDIQEGLSYLYPLSTIAAHVSSSPHQQTLRKTPLSTRFNVCAFGLLGYELDLKYLNHIDKKEIKDQIKFYKKHRKIFQYGKFSRSDKINNNIVWQCTFNNKAILGFYQKLAETNKGFDKIKIKGLNKDNKYIVESVQKKIPITRFGELIKHVLPIDLNPDGMIIRYINKFYALTDCIEKYECYVDLLQEGIVLKSQFMGTYYNENTRLLGDFGSSLYTINKRDEV